MTVSHWPAFGQAFLKIMSKYMQRNIVGGAFFSAMRTQGRIGREKMIARKKKCGRETLYSLQRDTCNFVLFPLMQLL